MKAGHSSFNSDDCQMVIHWDEKGGPGTRKVASDLCSFPLPSFRPANKTFSDNFLGGEVLFSRNRRGVHFVISYGQQLRVLAVREIKLTAFKSWGRGCFQPYKTGPPDNPNPLIKAFSVFRAGSMEP